MEEYIYTGSKGEQIPVSKLQNSHLVNALVKLVGMLTVAEGVKVDEGEELKKGINALKAEVLKRMPIQ